ncbi:hypothetical protein [Azospirillum griseum]|uniref:Uncharacterized protein n=1 Tax=Azospirillum griseum TaxID=2496639 RepID=A0A431VDK5_9PROT|nr:hypothetical protein [Azospirillum griseum]RTR17215.1 hypothetical protein EJ903_18535 [Azospirillum griseum]
MSESHPPLSNKPAELGDNRIYNAVVAFCIVLTVVTTVIFAHSLSAYFIVMKGGKAPGGSGDKASGESKEISLGDYGSQGDFFGGHFGPIIGSLTLLVVIYSGHVQLQSQNRFFREQQRKADEALFYQSFTQGLDLISQWDRTEAGCSQALRLVDYYARIACERKEPELYRLLNTVITGKMRNLLEGGGEEYFITNYPYAVVALEEIKKIRKETMDFKKEHKDILDAAKLKVKPRTKEGKTEK